MLLGALLLAACLSGTWTTNGPHGGDMTAIASTAANTRILYAGSTSGVLRSDDGGASWKSVGGPLRRVALLAVDPNNPEHVLAATTLSETEGEVWRTTNGGAEWTRVDLPKPLRPTRLLFDPSGTMYIGSTCQPYFKSGVQTDFHEAAGVYRSTDGGATWTNLKELAATCVDDLALDPANPAHLFSRTYGGGQDESLDGGTTWTSNANVPSREVVAHPSDPNVRFGISNSGHARFYTSHDAGSTWTEITPQGVSGTVYNSLTMDRGTGRLFLGTDDGLFRSGDGGRVWLRIGTSKTVVSDIAVDPSTRDVIASTSFGLVGTTFPYAETRMLDTRDAATYTLQVIVQQNDPQRMFAASLDTHDQYLPSNKSRVFRSRDGGRSWETIETANAMGRTLIAVDAAGDLYAAQAIGTKLRRLRRDANAFEELPRVFETIYQIAADPNRPGVIYVLTWHELLRSGDGGETWTAAPGTSSALLTFDPANSDDLILVTSYGGFITRYHNGVPGDVFQHDLLDSLIAIAPSQPSTMYGRIVLHTPELGGWNRIARSDNGGKDWTWLATPEPRTAITSMAVDPHDANTLWIATATQGVLVSHDGGRTLTRANNGLPTLRTLSLVFDPSGNALHLGTDQGVWTMRAQTRRRAVR